MSNAESIRTGINEALTDLGVMQRSLREASLKLVKNPNDTELAESLDQIERKMEGKQRHLKRLAAALEGAEQDAVEEARRAQEAEREAAVARCSDHRKELEKVAEEVETACARLIESLQAGAHHAGAAWGGVMRCRPCQRAPVVH